MKWNGLIMGFFFPPYPMSEGGMQPFRVLPVFLIGVFLFLLVSGPRDLS
jgi:hypothetical protein